MISVGTLQCYHGSVIDGECKCESDYTGIYCEKKMNCLGFYRFENGSCKGCQSGYKGEYCEIIDCGEHGEEREDDHTCICEPPFSGKFCEKLDTSKVYLYYNSKVTNTVGPLGVLIVIPLIVLLICCDRFAKRRHVVRLEKAIEKATSTEVDPELVQKILNED